MPLFKNQQRPKKYEQDNLITTELGWANNVIFDFQIFSNPTLVKSKNENHQILMCDTSKEPLDHKSEDKIKKY